MAFSLDDLAVSDPELSEKVGAYFLSLEASDAPLVSNAAISLLHLPGALQMSREFQGFHPLVQCLSGLILSDNRTSDHHVLVLNTPLRGFVLHLSHDGESRFVFDDIEAFLLAARRADSAGEALEKRHPVHSPIVKDQEGVRDFISSLLSTSADIVPTLVRSLDLLEPAFLIRLIDGEDFFIGEAVGREIEQRPALHLLPAAEHCAHHAHPMVREAGARALEQLGRLKGSQPGQGPS